MSDNGKKPKLSKPETRAALGRVMRCKAAQGKPTKISNTDTRDIEPPPKKKK